MHLRKKRKRQVWKTEYGDSITANIRYPKINFPLISGVNPIFSSVREIFIYWRDSESSLKLKKIYT